MRFSIYQPGDLTDGLTGTKRDENMAMVCHTIDKIDVDLLRPGIFADVAQ
jgi:hypothetical protein